MKSYQYDAYGRILSAPGTLTYNPFVYTARERHVASGLYYYRARWYDPQLGRFLTQDPIGHVGGINLYGYVGNAPADFRDPLGLLDPYFPYSPGQAVYGSLKYALEPLVSAFEAASTAIGNCGEQLYRLSYSPVLPGERAILRAPDEFQDICISLADDICNIISIGADGGIFVFKLLLPELPPENQRCPVAS